MKIAYMILAHANPKHLERLIKTLSDKDSAIFIHIDKKSDLALFSKIKGDNIHFVQNRVKVYWGDYSIVKATNTLINEALSHPDNYQRLVLLSGAVYPIKPSLYIQEIFKSNPHREYMNIVSMPSSTVNKPLSRLTKFVSRPYDSIYTKAMYKLLNKIRIKRNYKKALGGIRPCAGSQWWALTRNSCEYISSFIAENPAFISVFEKSICPDEMFFQTILGNSPFKKNIGRNLTYSQWIEGRPNPENITEEHLSLLKKKEPLIFEDAYGKGELLFARKFTDETSPVIYSINKDI